MADVLRIVLQDAAQWSRSALRAHPPHDRGFIGFWTIVIAVWTWRSDRRRWMKYLGAGALATVIAQEFSDGIRCCIFCLISTAHAAVGKDIFLHRGLPSRFSPAVNGRKAPRAEKAMTRRPAYSAEHCCRFVCSTFS